MTELSYKNDLINSLDLDSLTESQVNLLCHFVGFLKKYQGCSKMCSDTVVMLLKKGIPNGSYQDYVLLTDLVSILGSIELVLDEELA